MRIDIAGQRFGRLLVIGPVGAGARMKWACKCDCGNTMETRSRSLRSGETKSCGCLHREIVRNLVRTHGMHASREYRAWSAIKDRCFRQGNSEFHNYGGRGITMCARWLESFENFLADMGPRPSAKHSIDRIDNDGNYEPGNCQWSTTSEQARNKRTTRMITIDGTTRCIADWADALGVPRNRIRHRLNNGWSERDAVLTPALKSKSGHPSGFSSKSWRSPS